MKEQKYIRNKLIKNIIFYLVILILIFSAFSFFILSQFSHYLYTSVDKEILQYKKPFIDNFTNKFIDLVDDIISIEFNIKNKYILESFYPILFRKKF